MIACGVLLAVMWLVGAKFEFAKKMGWINLRIKGICFSFSDIKQNWQSIKFPHKIQTTLRFHEFTVNKGNFFLCLRFSGGTCPSNPANIVIE